MDKIDEKELIYQQMNLLMEERREITKAYNVLKYLLRNLDTEQGMNYSINDIRQVILPPNATKVTTDCQ